MSDASPENRAHPCRVRAALWSKEWHEQRWRFFLGTLVLTALLAGLLRAEVIPQNEASLLIYWPVGVVLVIFLAMGSVAAERADRTWEFLIAQPISRAQVLRAKWRMGLVQLVGMMTIATIAGALAMWSRGFRLMPSHPYGTSDAAQRDLFDRTVYLTSNWLSIHPVILLCVVATASTAALACWYTVLFLILTRARNEFAAALGGILLTIAVHAWLAQFVEVGMRGLRGPFLISALLNPLSPLVLAMVPGYAAFLPAIVPIHIGLWIILPLYVMRRRLGAGGTR